MTRVILNYIFVWICLLILPVHALYSQGDDIQSEVDKLNELIADGNNSQALILIEDILFKDPSNIDVQEKKISILTLEERSKEALADIEEYITLYPLKGEYYYLRALISMQKEKYPKAINDFETAEKSGMPEKYAYKLYLNRGMAHFALVDFDLADADFSKVLELSPKNAAAYHGRGMIKYEERDYEEALMEFQKSIEIDENNAITHFNMAMTYFRLEEKDNACYHFNRSCALGHRNACRLLMLECTSELKLSK